MKKIAAIVLAAGEGTRMKSSLPKVLHPICGKPMIFYLMQTLREIGVGKTIVVVGHKSDLVRKVLYGADCVEQKKLLGTGDAVAKAKKTLLKEKAAESVLIVCGDVPLLTPHTLTKLIEMHVSTSSACTLLTAKLKNPTGYGRILRAGNDKITKIIEELDASIYEKVIEEINVGVYCFDKEILFDVLDRIRPDNRKKEYYLTDVIELLSKKGEFVNSVDTSDAREFIGINTRKDLAEAEKIMRHRLMEKIADGGVTIIDPANTYIEEGAFIDKDTVIYPYTFIEKGVKIGSNCLIGPFARLREGTVLKDNVSVRNFAELVRSAVGNNTKINHQCYIGDASIGNNVNIGAGTIVANYDGRKKNKTIIRDNSFIGSGTIIVAPVKIGKGAVTGAGSVVTKRKDVPAGKTVVGIPARILRKKIKRPR